MTTPDEAAREARALCDALNKHHYPATMTGEPQCPSCAKIAAAFRARDVELARLRGQVKSGDHLHALVSWMVAATHSTPESIPDDARAMAQVTDILRLRARLEEVERERDIARHCEQEALARCVHCGGPHNRHEACVARWERAEQERDAARANLAAARADPSYVGIAQAPCGESNCPNITQGTFYCVLHRYCWTCGRERVRGEDHSRCR